jgi:transcriptional repressor NrdR
MKCPYCLHEHTKVIDSRETTDVHSIRRRRQCLDCDKRFTTYEKIETVDLAIVKKDGTREKFSREKLLRGLLKACEKRPIPRAKIEMKVAAIEADLRKKERQEIPARKVGEMVMDHIKDLDHVAYVRFASVYRRFKDVNQFEKEISMLKGGRKK